MKMTRRLSLLIFYTLVTAASAASFWGLCWMFLGHVPSAGPFRLSQGITLNWHLSRWWDVLAYPVWAAYLVDCLTCTGDQFEKFASPKALAVFALCALGGIAVTGFGTLDMGALAALIAAAGFGVIDGIGTPEWGWPPSLGSRDPIPGAYFIGPGLGFGASFVLGGPIGLLYGLAVTLVSVMVVGLGIFVGAAIRRMIMSFGF
jgi:hypothetical protein